MEGVFSFTLWRKSAARVLGMGVLSGWVCLERLGMVGSCVIVSSIIASMLVTKSKENSKQVQSPSPYPGQNPNRRNAI